MTPITADHRGLFPQSGYDLVFTTKNPEKVAVGKAIITGFFGPGKVVTVKPAVSELHTPTQPVGADIQWGAESRIDLVKRTMSEHNPARQILVSFENGLQVDTKSEEKKVADVACACLEMGGRRFFGESVAVPVQVNGEQVGLVTEEILDFLNRDLAGYDFTKRYELLTPEQQRAFNLMVFGHEDGPDGDDAIGSQQVAGFRQRVIEVLQKKGVGDYWEEYSNGSLSRDRGLSQAIKSAIRQLINSQRGQDKLTLAETFQQTLISQGLPASLGGRYGQTVWMRDFGIMINTLDHQDVSRPEAYSALLNSLTTIANHQYDSGLVPQVVVPDPLLPELVYLRMLGGDHGPSWYAGLQTFLQTHYPEVASQLPQLNTKDLRTLALPVLKERVAVIKTIYREISAKAREDGLTMPQTSHTLNGFLTDTLATLTPGTTDSEIHFIRSFTKLLDLATSHEQKSQVQAMIPSLARAMAYLDQHVLDPDTKLPQGGDNRDMLDSFLLEKLLCSNTCFLYEGFSGLVSHFDVIGPELAFELKKYLPAGQEPASGFISALLHGRLQAQQALEQLGQQIRDTFIYPKGVFAPLDFVNSEHKVQQRKPKAPEGYIPALVEQNTAFLQGREVNLQGLALAIELGLVDRADHPAAVELIHSQVTRAGLKVFSPINMASDHEIELLQQSQGFLVWPQIECRVIHVLKTCMAETPEIRQLLTELASIDEQRAGFHEWYNTDESHQKVHAGGAENQSWYITNLVQAFR